ncbi:MAG: outer membrane beta-barrel protein [Cyclobacteriaceae bacterium]|nr:outer membrane beta-barrel protein [Cyclobacteriaceae bacterium]
MAKYMIIYCLMLVTINASYAQEYKKLKVGLGFGYALAGGENSESGLLYSIEPAYRISDKISIGIRAEAAIIKRGGLSRFPSTMDFASISSFTVNGQYFLNSSAIRPFVGAGVGVYSFGAYTTVVTILGQTNQKVSVSYPSESVFGFYPRVGFDFGHLSVSADYNIVASSKNDVAELTNSYLGFRVGFFFGGGKK